MDGEGWRFHYWEGGAIDGSINATETVTLSADVTLIAHYLPSPTLRVGLVGQGLVSPSPGLYAHTNGQQVTLTATETRKPRDRLRVFNP